ncbi:DUF2911 domain-containing protein [Flavobacterium sp.]|uniref:DUF2911 domain-containing protein n=1 Tax=Flavobacterium sp. TaxID=239 RepID=UPI0035279B22
MKKGFILLLVFTLNSFLYAQVKVPQASPAAKVEQVVGLTTVNIEYSRPSIKGRTVYGDLVPFGKYWRTGANACTTIHFSTDVTIDNKTLKAGKYALYTLPKADTWTVIFYNDTTAWGLPQEWNDEAVALRVMINPTILSQSVETFTIQVDNITNDSATLDILWERTKITVPFTVPTKDIALASINKVISGPARADFYAAAQYYYQSNQDLNQALLWVDKAVEGDNTPFWYYRLKSLIQAKMGNKKGAIETAKMSLDGAIKAGNSDYEKMNKESIAEWSK